MNASRLALTLAAVLTLGGCDRYADPQGSAPTPTAPPGTQAPTVTPMYVKGNPVLSLEEAMQFRAQQVSGATRYGWTVRGQGTANITSLDGTRIVSVTGTSLGPAVVRAEAFDSQNRLLATGTLAVTVQ